LRFRADAFAWVIASALVVLTVSVADVARGDDLLDLGASLDGNALGQYLDHYEDPSGDLTLDAVTRRASEGAFAQVREAFPTYGLSRSAHWLRLRTRNPTSKAQRWYLEVAYPHLDELSLFEPLADGTYREHRTGDSLPYVQRDLAYYNFLFPLHEPAESQRTFYLRVRSSGTVPVPIFAWTRNELWAHQLAVWTLYAMFYGALLLMAAHATCVFLFTRQVEQLYYALYLVAAFAGNFCLAGHTFAFVLPDHPAVAQRMTLATIDASFLTAALLLRSQLSRETQGTFQFVWAVRGLVLLLFVIATFPLGIATALTTAVTLLVGVDGIPIAVRVAKGGTKEAKLFAYAFFLPVLGVAISAAHTAGLLQSSPLARWSMHLCVAAQTILISSSLADKLTSAREAVDQLQASLVQKLQELSGALTRAKEATRQAEHATVARDHFLATISHEFRTPLNAIINLPQGLSGQFQHVPYVVCQHCEAEFSLDVGERFDSTIPCPECAAKAVLALRERCEFTGDASRVREYMLRVERSGHGLLRVVNGVLEFSRLEAGHAPLSLSPVSVPHTVAHSLHQLRRELLEKPFHVQLDLAENVYVRADAEKLRDVFDQLLHNAIKFSGPNAAISVSARARDTQWVMEVRDDGIGIEKAHLSEIFASFEQVSKGATRSHGGTGLGLAICKAIVEAHGGTIWAESEEGGGTAICFALSMAPAPDTHIAEAG
jgi:signal transduction histidine kinase